MEKISFVIPCYGSQGTVVKVVEEIISTVCKRKEYDYEIILVNDNSPDNVQSVICELAKDNKKVKYIELADNFGQHSAIMAGFSFVTGDIVVCLDDDGQTPANEMFSLVDTLGDDCDLVFANYGSHKKHSLFRNFGSKINNYMAVWLINKPKDLAIMSYFACKRFIVDEVVRYKNPYPYISGLLLRATGKVKNVEVHHRERYEGDSGYNVKKLLRLWFNGFTAFSVKPLRVASFIGFIFSLIGFLFGFYIVINKIFNPATPIGYSSLMAVLLLVGGIIMIMLGLIGEYIGRIYISLNNSPQYVIRNTVNVEAKKKDE